MQENKKSYTGWIKWEPTSDEWVDLYSNNTVPFEMKENEYLLVYENERGETKLTSTYCYEEGKLRKVPKGSIVAAKSKEKFNKEAKTIYPRNDEQICAFDMVKDRTKTIKVITGTWGTGKTLIMVEAALEALRKGEFEQIVWIRNNVDVKDTKDLGALPGDVWEKLKPFVGPFIDHCGEEEAKSMIERGTLVVEPLQFLRGRNIENAIIMCSEAENLTKEHIQLIIARAADGSEVWFDGDTRQRDKVAFEKSKGLETVIERFAGKELFGYVHLTHSERSATAAMADLLNN